MLQLIYEKIHGLLAIANLVAAIFGGGYFLWLHGQFSSYSPAKDVLGILITLAIMTAIGYVARVHFKISKTGQTKKSLLVLSIINVVLFAFGWFAGSTCDELGCVVLIPIGVILAVTFLITFIISIKTSKIIVA